MSLSNTVLPKPTNWQDFERNIRDLFECVLGDPDTQLNGRSGQPQHGVDVYGYRNQQTDYLVGVQCKQKLDGKVTEKELRDEVNKAKNFTPKISQFILVTTAPRDQKIQETARIITKELAETQHPIKVYVWGWQDIQEHAAKYEKAWKAFDPTWNPFVEIGINEIKDSIKELNGSIEMKNQNISNNASSSPTKVNLDDNEDTPLHGQITAFQNLISEGEVHTAHKQFLKLKEEVWSDASPSERYRILVGIASAKLQIGNQEEAGQLLLDAYNEYPEHKNANKNKAAGHLLIGDDRKAEEIAYKIMTEKEDPYVASVFIQSQISNIECENPLIQVPEGLHESEDVFNAYIHFLRMRDNSEWLEYAKKAYEKYPDNKMLEKVYAESVFVRFINYDRDAIIGGIFKETKYNELNKAVEILYQNVKESLNNGLLLLPETAYNASLALRLTDDNERAKEILDNSIIKYPNNEMLLFQRALMAYAENDLEGAKDLLPKDLSNLEIISLKANIYSELDEMEDALSLIDEIKGKELSEHIKADVLRVHVKSYVEEGEISTAIKMINEEIDHEPSNFMYRNLLIRTYYNIGQNDKANKALNEAVEIVDERTSLYNRLGLSMEAQILGRNSVIIELLKDKVATDRDSKGLRLLIETSIESGHWATARKYFDLASDNLEHKKWFLKAKAFFSLKTGYNKQDDILSQYLRIYPNDINMILAQIGNWQRTGRVIEIRRFLKNLNLSDLEGSPEKKANLATIISYYGEVLRGLEYAYTLLMNNWSNFNVHLIYQSLIFLNNDIEEVIPSADTVKDKTVVCILSERKEKRYRIDNNIYVNFEDERINPDDDLGKLLYGKHLGDEFKLNIKMYSKNVKIKWIKSIYLDAF
ncbi:MAG: restriction endonuclease, partial [Halanaerobiales bacterium]